MAFGEHKEKHFLAGALVGIVSVTVAIVFGDGSIWLRVVAWFIAFISLLWCIGPGHAPMIILLAADRIRGLFRRRS